MEAKKIVKTLLKYKEEEFSTNFLDRCIKYFKSIESEKIHRIEEKEESLAGLRLHCMYNDYYYYLLPRRPKNLSYRKLDLSKKQLFNLSNQIEGDDNDNFIICNELKSFKIKTYYLTVSEEELNTDHLISENIFLGLVGIHDLYFLENQNLSHYCNETIDKLNKESMSLIKELKEYRENYLKLDWKVRDRLLVHSGEVLHFYGTIYTDDIDTIFLQNKQKIRIKDYFSGNLDVSDIYPTDIKRNNIYSRFHIFSRHIGAENFSEILINTKYHFYFLGIKLVSLPYSVVGRLSRCTPSDLSDIFTLQKINKINAEKLVSGNMFSIKNLAFKYGSPVFVSKNIESQIQKKLKTWWNINLSLNTIKNKLKFCDNTLDLFYKDDCYYQDDLTLTIIDETLERSGKIIKMNTVNKKNILCVESGNVKKLISNSASGLFYLGNNEKFYKDTDVKLYNKKDDIKFDVFLFFFSTYNLGNITSILNNTPVVIFVFPDGEKIEKDINKHGSIEVKKNEVLYYCVYKKGNKHMFFGKQIQGLQNGRIEKLIYRKKLIGLMQKNNYSTMVDKSLSQIGRSEKIDPLVKKVLSYQRVLVFKK